MLTGVPGEPMRLEQGGAAAGYPELVVGARAGADGGPRTAMQVADGVTSEAEAGPAPLSEAEDTVQPFAASVGPRTQIATAEEGSLQGLPGADVSSCIQELQLPPATPAAGPAAKRAPPHPQPAAGTAGLRPAQDAAGRLQEQQLSDLPLRLAPEVGPVGSRERYGESAKRPTSTDATALVSDKGGKAMGASLKDIDVPTSIDEGSVPRAEMRPRALRAEANPADFVWSLPRILYRAAAYLAWQWVLFMAVVGVLPLAFVLCLLFQLRPPNPGREEPPASRERRGRAGNSRPPDEAKPNGRFLASGSSAGM